jgi:hypothetical protein
MAAASPSGRSFDKGVGVGGRVDSTVRVEEGWGVSGAAAVAVSRMLTAWERGVTAVMSPELTEQAVKLPINTRKANRARKFLISIASLTMESITKGATPGALRIWHPTSS